MGLGRGGGLASASAGMTNMRRTTRIIFMGGWSSPLAFSMRVSYLRIRCLQHPLGNLMFSLTHVTTLVLTSSSTRLVWDFIIIVWQRLPLLYVSQTVYLPCVCARMCRTLCCHTASPVRMTLENNEQPIEDNKHMWFLEPLCESFAKRICLLAASRVSYVLSRWGFRFHVIGGSCSHWGLIQIIIPRCACQAVNAQELSAKPWVPMQVAPAPHAIA